MRDDLTDITVILDRSGSMESIKSDTIGGFNQFLSDQKQAPGQAKFTLVQFDDVIEMLIGGLPIADVPPLTTRTYLPRASTALLDAIGQTIERTGERLKSWPESERPARVMMVIITDGQENASRLFNRARVNEMIRHQTDKYGWVFLFLGANMDAVTEAHSIGIGQSHSMSFKATGPHTHAVYAAISDKVLRARAAAPDMVAAAATFTVEDRAAQELGETVLGTDTTTSASSGTAP